MFGRKKSVTWTRKTTRTVVAFNLEAMAYRVKQGLSSTAELISDLQWQIERLKD